MSQQQRAGNVKAEAANSETKQAAVAAENLDTNKEASEIAALKAELEEARSKIEQVESDKKKAEAEAAKLNARIESQVTREEEAVKRQLNAQRKVRILIPSGRGDHERAPVPVAVNGREYLIVRDKEVEVPEAVIGVLDLAVETVFVPTGEGVSRQNVPQQRPAFPYKMLGYVDKKTGEVDA